jgi:hypothetical protein
VTGTKDRTSASQEGWAGHEALMGDVRNALKVLVGKVKGKDHWEDLGVDGSIFKLRERSWMSQDEYWRAVVNTVMNIRFS